MPPPYILTLILDEALSGKLNILRKRHFPPERNVLDAHVTLFHSLPAEHDEAIRDDLREVCLEQQAFRVVLPELKHWGKGVFVILESPDLLKVRAVLAEKWNEYLTAQDKQGYRPHVTIQNKVRPEVTRLLHESLLATWHPLEGEALGLHLWRYEGGPWSSIEQFAFGKIGQT